MEQASLVDGSSFDTLAFEQDGFSSAEIDIRRRQIIDALVITPMIVVLDEGFDMRFEIAGQIIILQQDLVFECLMPALDFTLRLGMAWRAADVIDVSRIEPFGQIGGDIAGAVVRQQPRPVPDMGLFAA